MISPNCRTMTRWTVSAICLGAWGLLGCATPTSAVAAKPDAADDGVDATVSAGPLDCEVDSLGGSPLSDVCPPDGCLTSAPDVPDAAGVERADAEEVDIDIGPCDGLFLTSGRLGWADGGGAYPGKTESLDFDSVALGLAATAVVVVENVKYFDPESITGVDFVGSPAFAVRFSGCTEWARISGGLPCGRKSKSVDGQEKLPIVVRFAPINPGLHTAVITLLLIDPCESVAPLTLSVSGVGKE